MPSTEYNRLIGYGVNAIMPFVLFGASDQPALSPGEGTNVPTVYYMEASQRYTGIDLDYYRVMLTPYEFTAYIDFIGGEEWEILPEDFEEIYYPEYEE